MQINQAQPAQPAQPAQSVIEHIHQFCRDVDAWCQSTFARVRDPDEVIDSINKVEAGFQQAVRKLEQWVSHDSQRQNLRYHLDSHLSRVRRCVRENNERWLRAWDLEMTKHRILMAFPTSDSKYQDKPWHVNEVCCLIMRVQLYLRKFKNAMARHGVDLVLLQHETPTNIDMDQVWAVCAKLHQYYLRLVGVLNEQELSWEAARLGCETLDSLIECRQHVHAWAGVEFDLPDLAFDLHDCSQHHPGVLRGLGLVIDETLATASLMQQL